MQAIPDVTGRDKRQRPASKRLVPTIVVSPNRTGTGNEATAPSGRDIVPELRMTTMPPSMDSTR